jgi:hypothetical protein
LVNSLEGAQRRLRYLLGLGTRGTGLVAAVFHDILHQFADAIEAASEGEVGVVEVDLLVVLRLPMSEVHHGLGGDQVWLEELELPLGLVVLVLQVVEQHVHLCEVGSGDRHLVQLLGKNAV